MYVNVLNIVPQMPMGFEKYVKLFTLKVGSIPTLFQQHQKKWKMKVLDECPQEQDESSAVKDDI